MAFHFSRLIVAIVAAALAAGTAHALVLDLADVIGGGDGTGTGTPGTGIDPRTGNVVTVAGVNNPGTPNVYSTVAHPYIDGVFVPDGDVGGPVATQVTSTGLTANFPNTDGNSWENGMGFNASCCSSNLRIGGVVTDVFAAPHTGIGFHSNKGVTFDLDAIRQATEYFPTRYTAFVDAAVGPGANADIDHFVLVDGVIVDQALNLVDDGSNAVFFDVAIPLDADFLTLVGTNGADQNYSYDQGIIGDPRLHLVIPEPSTLALTALGLAVFAIGYRRRRPSHRGPPKAISPLLHARCSGPVRHGL